MRSRKLVRSLATFIDSIDEPMIFCSRLIRINKGHIGIPGDVLLPVEDIGIKQTVLVIIERLQPGLNLA